MTFILWQKQTWLAGKAYYHQFHQKAQDVADKPRDAFVHYTMSYVDPIKIKNRRDVVFGRYHLICPAVRR